MNRRPCPTCSPHSSRLLALALGALLALVAAPLPAAAQNTQTGAVGGRVTDEQGAPIIGADVLIEQTRLATQTGTGGEYLIEPVPAGTHSVRVRMIGYRSEADTVNVTAGGRAAADFTLTRDPLQLETMVVTGTQVPRMNLEASVAVTTLTPQEIERAAPRSTTEMLRYVPGFTRVESSGGEVNQNIGLRGILNQEYVMLMEDGMPVYPTMHTFFMNADNLIRYDENIERMEVVRGGASALFGSNTPGAIINFINKTGTDRFGGSMKATAATRGLARYDVNVGGPMGDDWRFNLGGFYRYDHGVRDPGYPGIRGGQIKANVTRELENGYLRASVKYIDDRNQFILPLPFADPGDPEFVPGLSNYAAMSSNEGMDLRIPIPTGDLTLPLDNGLMTRATWFTVDAAFDLADGWRLQNTAQVMQNDQQFNAIVPSNAFAVDDWVTGDPGQAGLGLPAGTTVQLTFTNHRDPEGVPLPFNTSNGLIAPGQQWHVEKPISAIQDQLQLRRSFGPHSLVIGAYFANYSQDNRWYFTDILTDVRDNPRFVDAIVTPPGEAPIQLTENGFRNYLSLYRNGSGQTSVLSGVVGGEVQMTDRLRADLGVRVEYNTYVQSAENSSTFDLDDNPDTPFNNEQFGDGSFRHFSRDITDWAASLGLNYQLRDNLSLYASGSRGYKMPALDEFLDAQAQDQVDLFDAREVRSVEGGVKGQLGRLGFTVNGFYTDLKNIVSQGLVVDPNTGETAWTIQTSPETRSYGAEVEVVASPVEGLQLFGSGTILEAEFGSGTDIGSRLTGVPSTIGNVAALYSSPQGFRLKGDWHWVGERSVAIDAAIRLPAYSYVNFGAGYTLPGGGTTINLDLLNAFQGTGLEEANARILAAGVGGIFLARPILPRRLQLSVGYDFGAVGGTETTQQ